MALPGFPWLLLFLLVAVTPLTGSCGDRARTGSLLVQCYSSPPAPTNATNGTEFRASLLPLLRALPSAAAPTGFASLGSPGSHRAFVRGLCFGNSTVPSDCRGCLSAAARNITAGCSATTRRAGVWSAGCFLAYADTNASSPREDAFRSRVLLRGREDAVAVSRGNSRSYYSEYNHAQLVAMVQIAVQSAAANISRARMLATADTATDERCRLRTTVHVLAQCARDRTAAECVRCLHDSARAVYWDVGADNGDGGVAAAVVAFHCYLRFDVSTVLVLPLGTDGFTLFFIIVGASVAVGLVCAFCAPFSLMKRRSRIKRRCRMKRRASMQQRQEHVSSLLFRS